MHKMRTLETIDHRRRLIVGAAAITLAAVELGMSRRAQAAQSSFGALKDIDAGVLKVGYAETGPADGPPVILLHGWPYDIHTYVDVAPCWRRKAIA